MNKTENVVNRMKDLMVEIDDEKTIKEFINEISENGKNLIFQLHSDPLNVYRSVSLGGARLNMNQILDRMAESVGRDLKCVYDIDDGNRWRVSFAD